MVECNRLKTEKQQLVDRSAKMDMTMSNRTLTLDRDQVDELRTCLELLSAIETIEYHNKNWLPIWAIKNAKTLSEEKRDLMERALEIIGRSTCSTHT